VLKVGPHWARSKLQRGAALEWQLELPIYHPTSSLVLVAYAEPKKPEILGKLQYRGLMLANNRRGGWRAVGLVWVGWVEGDASEAGLVKQ